MKEFIGLRPKSYSFLKDGDSEDEKSKDTKKRVIKRKLEFEDYRHCLETTQIKNKIDHSERKNLNVENLQKIIKNS